MSGDRAAALVVLRSASGVSPDEPATAATLERHAPDPALAERARAELERLGVEVGPLVGKSFSIAAPRRLLEHLFQGFSEAEGSGRELPLDALPPAVRGAVSAVVSQAPPDFGPLP